MSLRKHNCKYYCVYASWCNAFQKEVNDKDCEECKERKDYEPTKM